MCGWHTWPMMNRKATEFDGVWMTLCVVAGVVKRIIPAVASTNAVIAGQYSSSLSCLGGRGGGGSLFILSLWVGKKGMPIESYL